MRYVPLAVLVASLSLFPTARAADIAGSQDHPMISRYEGSEIIKYETRAFDSVELLSGKISKYEHKRVPENDSAYTKVEGKYTRISYAAPQGRSAIEVFRNYDKALTAAGFEVQFRCEKSECDMGGGRGFNLAAAPKDLFSKMTGQHVEQRYLLAKLPRETGHVYASLYLTAATHIGGDDRNRVFANLIVVETQGMEGGKVKVDAAAMAQGLDADGHIALYEILFDTNKAELKGDSNTALTEIAKLLKDKPSLKVLIVGHTDNAGDLAHNQSLSERRAKAVVDTLVDKHDIRRDRLTAVGVGMAAPVASNDTEPGRAKNRRVELVKR